MNALVITYYIDYEAGPILAYVKDLGDSRFAVDAAYIIDGKGRTVCTARS